MLDLMSSAIDEKNVLKVFTISESSAIIWPLKYTYTTSPTPTQPLLHLHNLSYTYTTSQIPTQPLRYLHNLSYTYTTLSSVSPLIIKIKDQRNISPPPFILYLQAGEIGWLDDR